MYLRMMQKKLYLVIYLLVCVFLIGFSYTKAKTISGKVINVIDGNTLILLTDTKEKVKIVLWGTDCPEISQTFGDMAHKHVDELLFKKNVIIEIMGKDKQGNKLGIVYLKNKNINLFLVKNGFAWAEEYYSRGVYAKEQSEARATATGLWQEPDPVAPWIFLRQKSMSTAKGL